MRHEHSIDEIFYGSVTVGERGQIVIPAQARGDYEISPGEKLLVFGHPTGTGLTMVKMSGIAEFAEMAKRALALAEDAVSEQDSSEES